MLYILDSCYKTLDFAHKVSRWFALLRDQMRQTPSYDLCLAMQFIPQEFANLQVTREEFLCMKAIILLNTGKPRQASRG